MFPDFNIYSTPLLVLSLQGLIFAVLIFQRYLKKGNPSDLYLALVLLITCYHQTSYTVGFMGWYDTYRTTKINYYLVDAMMALAPLLYFYIRSITQPQWQWSRRNWLHFIPFGLLLLTKIIILGYDATTDGWSDAQNGPMVVNFEWKYVQPLFGLVTMLQTLVYLMLSFQLLYGYREQIREYFSNSFKLELSWLHGFLIVYTFLYAYNSIQTVVDAFIMDVSWWQGWWYYFLSGIAIIYIGVKGYMTDLSALRDVDLRSYIKEKVRKPKAAELITEIPDKIISQKEKLEQYIAQERPYLNQELTLTTLARQLKIPREDLSETINRGMNQKFNDYINGLRVEAFKKEIAAGRHKELSLLGIALECGFNSKATFNRAFKKATGTSPSAYTNQLITK